MPRREFLSRVIAFKVSINSVTSKNRFRDVFRTGMNMLTDVITRNPSLEVAPTTLATTSLPVTVNFYL